MVDAVADPVMLKPSRRPSFCRSRQRRLRVDGLFVRLHGAARASDPAQFVQWVLPADPNRAGWEVGALRRARARRRGGGRFDSGDVSTGAGSIPADGERGAGPVDLEAGKSIMKGSTGAAAGPFAFLEATHMFWNHHPTLRLGPLDIDTGAIPELRALAGVPQPPKHHPEVDAWAHVLMAVEQARLLTAEPAVRFAVLLHDLEKGTTPADVLPQHIDHEECGVPLVHAVCDRLGAPPAWRELAALVCEHHTRCHRATEMSQAGKRRLLRRAGRSGG